MKKFVFLFFLLFTFSCISFCDNTVNTGYVVLSNSQIKLKNHLYYHSMKSFTLKFTELPDDLKDTLIWSTSDENIAVVDADGNITPKRAGYVTISVASSTDTNSKDSCYIYIYPRLNGLIGLDNRYKKGYKYTDDDGNEIPSIKSATVEDPDIILITQISNNIVYFKSLSEGLTRLIIIDNDDNTHYVSLGVIKPITFISSKEANISIEDLYNAKDELGIVIPKDFKISYANSSILGGDAAFVTYTENMITYKGNHNSTRTSHEILEGWDYLTVYTNNGEDYFYTNYYVHFYAKLESLSCWIPEMESGYEYKPQMSFTPAYASNREVICSSDNEEVATISGDYLNTEIILKALKPGTANITITSVDNPEVSKTYPITITQGEESLTLDSHEMNLLVNESKELKATILPSNVKNQKVCWYSYDKSIATVDDYGNVTGVAPGTVKIKAYRKHEDVCTVTVTNKIPVESINLDKNELNLILNDKGTLKASIIPVDASKQGLTWSSSNEDIATVDQDGNIETLCAGKTTIKVTSIDNPKAYAECIVNVVKIDISLDKTTISLNEGASENISATVKPDFLSDKSVKWISKDTSIATVSNGVVKGIKTGTTTVQAISNYDNKTYAECFVSVNIPIINVTGVELDKTKLTIKTGETTTLLANVLPENASYKTVIWSSSEDSIATVENGKIKGIKPGNVQITVKTVDGGYTATCELAVVQPVTDIILDQTTLYINIGWIKSLKATVLPEDASDKSVIWSSSNTEIATVSNEGEVCGKAIGKATISAITKDGNKIATCDVNVEILATAINLDENNLYLPKGGSTQLTATILPENATDKTVKWKSYDTDIVTISNTGEIQAVGLGHTCIEATTNNLCSAFCNISVYELTLDETSLNINKGDTYKFTATLLPMSQVFEKVTWKSSNPNVVSVENGTITGLTGGIATITATVIGREAFTASCVVTVNESVSSIELDKETITIKEGEKSTINATVLPYTATDKSVTWFSSDDSIATVEDGVVKGIKMGTATITATTNDGGFTDTCLVTVTDPTVKVTSVQLDKTSLSVKVGTTASLIANVLPADATDKSVTWSSSDNSIATVTNGVVKGIKAGSATITVKTNDGGYTAICNVTVTQPVTSIKVAPTTLSLAVGKTYTLKYTVYPTNASLKTVTWKSSNTKVVTVSSSGLVKGIAKGTATITAITTDGNKTATCKVTVTQPVTSIKVAPTTLSLAVGKTYTLKYTVYPTTASIKTVTWKSSNTKVATVTSAGVVKGIKAGSATITVTTTDGKKTATCKVTVTQPVTSVKVSSTTLSLEVGKTSTLKATVYPTNATTKTVTWKSSNTKIATVSSSGVVKGIKVGTAIITVTTTDGKKTATCKVTVKAPVVKVTGVKVSPTTLSLNTGKTYTLKATVTPSNATTKTVSWKSSNTKIATVTSSGVVKGIAKGTATITVTTTDGKKTATCKVTVTEPVVKVTGVKLSKSSLSLAKGKTAQLTATVLPTNATNKAVTWTSSNKAVATVSSTGLVKGIKAGSATITVTTIDGSKKATCKVTVK